MRAWRAARRLAIPPYRQESCKLRGAGPFFGKKTPFARKRSPDNMDLSPFSTGCHPALPPNAANRCWKPHFRRLSNDLLPEMAISESPCRKIMQNGERPVMCCKRNHS